MTESKARLSVQDGIAVLTLDNPPVNALSHASRIDIDRCLAEIVREDTLRGLVIVCAGKTFVAGAEISELGQILDPTLRGIIETLEGLRIPSIAALHGTALGGGFELALGCTFRIAADTARVGLPEVKLGLLPGAGGTVRATYLAGAEAALDLAGGGEMLTAEAARALGLVDSVFVGDPADSARAFLEDRIRTGELPPPVSQRGGNLPNCDPARLDAQAAQLCRDANSTAPMLTATAIKAACEATFAQAMKVERDLFLSSVTSYRSTALRHLFFAERAAAKPRVRASKRPVQSVGILGSGPGQDSLASAFASSGLDVLIHRPGGPKSANQQDQAYRLAPRAAQVSGVDDLGLCDLVIWSPSDHEASTRDAIAHWGATAKSGAILAATLPGAEIDELAKAASRPADVCGLQVFTAGASAGLAEIGASSSGAPDVVATMLNLGRRLGWQPVLSVGHVGNLTGRLMAAYQARLTQLLLAGTSVAQIDGALRGFGWGAAPLMRENRVGLVGLERHVPAFGDPDPLYECLCSPGMLDAQSDLGWHTHQGAAQRRPNPQLDEIVAGIAAPGRHGPDPTAGSDLIDALLDPLIEEGRLLTQQGHVARSSDLDVIWVHGFGFPRDSGGPMFWDDNGRPRGLADC